MSTHVLSNAELAEAIRVAWNSEHSSPLIHAHLQALLAVQLQRARGHYP